MNIRKEKGITLTTLVLTVMIMIILTSISVYTGTNLIRSANLQSVNTNMLQIQVKVKSISERVEFDKNNEYVGEKLSDDEATSLISKVNSDSSILGSYNSDLDKYYKLKNEDLVNLGLQAIQEKEDYVYVVNYANDEVIYTKGFKGEDKKMHYALSDMINID